MKTKLTEEQVLEWRKIANQASKIEAMVSELLVITAQAKIGDADKVKVLDWIDRAEAFSGLSYICTPQSEWLGGDSMDGKNFCYRPPHIAVKS